MKADAQARLNQLREGLHEAGDGLTPAEWKELLEELSADIEGHLDAVKEENPELR